MSGSSGSIVLDYYGRLVGIHIGINNSRKKKDDKIFFTRETFNKYLSIKSDQFQAFINETIVPNVRDEIKQLWLFSK